MPSIPVQDNVIVLSSASGGIGLTTLAATIAWTLTQRGISCALLEADLHGGGLDALLGMEDHGGLRLQEIDAPLGSIDGKALNQEIPRWEGVRLLPSSPWRGDPPDWWEIQAAVRALAGENQALLVDAAHGEALGDIPELQQATHLVAVDLSVVGLARAKTHVKRLLAMGGRPQPLLVGVMPRGAPKRHAGVVAMAEATVYLEDTLLGPIKTDAKLCGDMLEGMGIQAIPRCNRNAINAIADALLSHIKGSEA